MTKSQAKVLGAFGVGAAVLYYLDNTNKSATITALGRQVSGLDQALRVRAARVGALESERGELLRASDLAKGQLEHAKQQVATLGIEANALRAQVTAKDAELARLRAELAAAKEPKKS